MSSVHPTDEYKNQRRHRDPPCWCVQDHSGTVRLPEHGVDIACPSESLATLRFQVSISLPITTLCRILTIINGDKYLSLFHQLSGRCRHETGEEERRY